MGLGIEIWRQEITETLRQIRRKLEWSKKYDNFVETSHIDINLAKMVAKVEIDEYSPVGFPISEIEPKEKLNEVFFDTRMKYLFPPKNYRSVLKPYVDSERQFLAVITGFKSVKRKDDDVLVFYPEIRRSGSYEGKSYNPYMSYRSSLNSASRVANALRHISKEYGVKNLYVSAITFTFPKPYSLRNNHLTGWTQTWLLWKEFRFHLEKYLNPSGKGILAYSVNLHTWKSSDPLEPHFHFHVVLINCWAKKNPDPKSDQGSCYSITRAKPNLDKDELRRLWTVFLHSKGIGLDHKTIDVHHWGWNMDTHANRILHYIKYCRRQWFYDFAKFCFEHPNHIPAKAFKERIDRFVYYCNRTRVYGFWKYLTNLVPEKDVYDPINVDNVEKTNITLRGLPDDHRLAVYRAKGSKVEFVGVTTAKNLQDHVDKMNQILMNYFGDGG